MKHPSPLAGVRGWLVVAVCLQVIAEVATLATLVSVAGFVTTKACESCLAPSPPVIAVLTAFGVSLVARVLASTVTHHADASFQLSLRRRLLRAFARVPLAWFTRRGSAGVTQLIDRDVSALHYLVAHALLDLTTVVVLPTASLTWLVVAHGPIGLTAVVPLIVSATCYLLAMRGSATRFEEYAAAQARIAAAITEYVDGIAVVKSFGPAHTARGSYVGAVDDFHDFFRVWSSSTTRATVGSWLAASPALALGWTALWVVVVGPSPFTVVTLLLLAPAVCGPVAALGPRLQALRSGLQAAAHLRTALSETETAQIDQGEPDLCPSDSSVALHDVGFSYLPGRPALSHVSATLAAGTTTALIGPSGSGKSTLAALLARFAMPDEGRIEVGGADLARLTPTLVHQHIAFAFQDAVLLHATVTENLVGDRDVDHDRMVEVCRACEIDDRIRALPSGYATVVGPDCGLSGGEVQRIALARALLREPCVLVLDEPTSAADPHTQAALMNALHTLTQNTTVLMIAHRLDTLRTADRVLALDGGRIVADGPPDEVLSAVTRSME